MIRHVPIRVSQWRNWIEKPSTLRLLALEANWLANWLVQLRGQSLLYTGVDPQPEHIQRAFMQHHFRFEMPWQRAMTGFEAQVADHRWPLADAAVDVVVLQHTLDLSLKPHQLLKEASRVLQSGGYLVLTSFNPISAWSIGRWFCQLSPDLPWCIHPISGWRLEDWLHLLDCRIEYHGSAGLVWPLHLGRLDGLNMLDNLPVNPSFLPGAVQMIIARKTVAGMTPIHTTERSQSSGFSGVVPAARIDHQ